MPTVHERYRQQNVHIAIFGCRNHLATLFGLAVVENPGLAVEIVVISVILSEI